MKIVFFALLIAVLILPHVIHAGSPDNLDADEEYMLLLKYALETAPPLSAEYGRDRASETEQKKKIIISIESECAEAQIRTITSVSK
jgi:hypothetical protein